ncbi:hypothetical protein BDN72DRAFT_844828 [Pluteus cervinus]|uniref:Uncharacterized protein n=1 Tax=Pluteus cervinus TaxID=181527 RepID=A0ACD3AMB7_9AGAR|nr:hypothetical protein BDN72DRAFT_844828 [Pluteus cervinus]
MSSQGQQVFQSITAGPAQHDRSFEELRTECYSQASIAGRQRPHSVDASKTPWNVLPPSFQPHADADGDNDGDVVMSDEPSQEVPYFGNTSSGGVVGLH